MTIANRAYGRGSYSDKNVYFCHLNLLNWTENELSSVRTLHTEMGVGLVAVHAYMAAIMHS